MWRMIDHLSRNNERVLLTCSFEFHFYFLLIELIKSDNHVTKRDMGGGGGGGCCCLRAEWTDRIIHIISQVP